MPTVSFEIHFSARLQRCNTAGRPARNALLANASSCSDADRDAYGRSKKKRRRLLTYAVDALTRISDEGRSRLRKASGSCQTSFDPEMSEWGKPSRAWHGISNFKFLISKQIRMTEIRNEDRNKVFRLDMVIRLFSI